MASIDPVDYGFPEGALSELLRQIISNSLMKHDYGEDDELSDAYDCAAKSDILKFAAQNGLRIPMPYYQTRYQRAVDFQALEDDEDADVDAYSSFGPVDTLSGLCDAVFFWYEEKGAHGFDELVIDLLNFYVFTFCYYADIDVEFSAEYRSNFNSLIFAVQQLHNDNKKSKQAKKMNIAVIGSRAFHGINLIESYLDENITRKEGMKIISGGALGVDKIARDYAKARGINFIELKANWRLYGKGAGPIRNREIIDMADMIFAFWDGASRGTLNVIQGARRLGKDCQVVIYRDGFLWNNS